MKSILSVSIGVLFPLCSFSQSPSAFMEDPGIPELSKSVYGYYQQSMEEHSALRRFFRDSVRVGEMKEAFYKHHKDRPEVSPYAGRDSVAQIWPSVILNYSMKQSPLKAVRNCRGVWNDAGKLELKALLSPEGQPDEKGFGKLMDSYGQPLSGYTGDVLMLRSPERYMGYVVSAHPALRTYIDGKMVNFAWYQGPADYFSTIGIHGADGAWSSRVQSGAFHLGNVFNENCPPRNIPAKDACNFSVLLYDDGTGRYDLALLLPESPDSKTTDLFKKVRRVVRKLRPHLFRPYYTDDCKIMAGRYYRVEYSRKGWYVEDYLETYHDFQKQQQYAKQHANR